MHSTKYTIFFVLILSAVVALLLTGFREGTKDLAAAGEEIFNKRAILTTIETELGEGVDVGGLSAEEINEIFSTKMAEKALNMKGEVLTEQDIKAAGYPGGRVIDIDIKKEKKKPEQDRILPLYEYNGSEKVYIMSVIGSGLWDLIWGNIAVRSDKSTVIGVSFDHAGETPGLGAEIKDNPKFPASYAGKQLYNAEGDFVGITARKGGAVDPNHEVDGLSGATVTADGVTEMVVRGLKYYEPYLQKN
jgi:Na+-transporting NADH:ubiquinone oxidoreductase subunit C